MGHTLVTPEINDSDDSFFPRAEKIINEISMILYTDDISMI